MTGVTFMATVRIVSSRISGLLTAPLVSFFSTLVIVLSCIMPLRLFIIGCHLSMTRDYRCKELCAAIVPRPTFFATITVPTLCAPSAHFQVLTPAFYSVSVLLMTIFAFFVRRSNASCTTCAGTVSIRPWLRRGVPMLPLRRMLSLILRTPCLCPSFMGYRQN